MSGIYGNENANWSRTSAAPSGLNVVDGLLPGARAPGYRLPPLRGLMDIVIRDQGLAPPGYKPWPLRGQMDIVACYQGLTPLATNLCPVGAATGIGLCPNGAETYAGRWPPGYQA